MDIAKIALEEEVDRWIRFHTQKLREMHQYAIDLSNDRNYVNIELTMRHYGIVLADEIMITCHKPMPTHTEDIPTPITLGGPALSIESNPSSHKEEISVPQEVKKIDNSKYNVVDIIWAHPIKPKDTPTYTDFKII
jgi:hypothetical protein